MLKWTCTKEEIKTIRAIVLRAVGADDFSLERVMDIEAAHCNGNPLDLEGFLKAKTSDFHHDYYGIIYALDRATGKLLNCFTPRFSK